MGRVSAREVVMRGMKCDEGVCLNMCLGKNCLFLPHFFVIFIILNCACYS